MPPLTRKLAGKNLRLFWFINYSVIKKDIIEDLVLSVIY
jgi:hypothetical protein